MLAHSMFMEQIKMIIIEKLVDVKTGEEQIIEREESTNEKKEREAIEIANSKLKAEQAAKAEQRAALLERLGITEDEAKLLLG